MRQTFAATVIIPMVLLWGQQIEETTEEIGQESIAQYDQAIEEIKSWR